MKIYADCDILDGGACPGCKDHMALEAKISAAKQVLDDLLAQRPKIRTRINEKHDLLTTRAPLEIVCSVFQLCVPSKSSFYDLEDTSYFSSEKWMVSAPLLLGSICNAWRNIAWATKPLWTVFRLHLDGFKNPNIVVLTREWLERAGQLPLSIRISGFCDYDSLPEDLQDKMHKLVAIINQRSTQWQNLDVSGSTWLMPQLKGGAGGAPNIQSLRIQSIVRDWIPFSLMNGMSRLSHLRLDYYLPGHMNVLWTYLTHASLYKPYDRDVIALPQNAPNLVYCKFNSVKTGPSQFPLPKQPILHQSLRSLEFEADLQYGYSQSPLIIIFFRCFTFPNLQHLKLESGGTREQNGGQRLSWDLVVSNILNSSPPLVSLGIRNPAPHTATRILLPILHKTPSLRELEILVPIDEEDWDETKNELLQLITDTSIPSGTQADFLPNLRSLNLFADYDDVDVTTDDICEAISGIFGPIADIHNPLRRPLKTLRVREIAEQRLDLIESRDLLLQLLRLRREGIDIDVKCGDLGSIDIIEESMEDHGLTFESLNLGPGSSPITHE